MNFFKSKKSKILESDYITDSGRRVVKKIMDEGGSVFAERLFNYIGELEDRLEQLEGQKQ